MKWQLVQRELFRSSIWVNVFFLSEKNLYKSLLRNAFLYFPLNLWFHTLPSFTPPLVGQYTATRNSPHGHTHTTVLCCESSSHTTLSSAGQFLRMKRAWEWVRWMISIVTQPIPSQGFLKPEKLREKHLRKMKKMNPTFKWNNSDVTTRG